MTTPAANQTLETSARPNARKGIYTRIFLAVSNALAAREAFERLCRESDATPRTQNTSRNKEFTRIAQMF